jgi:hypothetical protein
MGGPSGWVVLTIHLRKCGEVKLPFCIDLEPLHYVIIKYVPVHVCARVLDHDEYSLAAEGLT